MTTATTMMQYRRQSISIGAHVGRDKSMVLAAALTLALAIIFSGPSADAQTLPLGGRTASMGGAGAASGRDAAMPYINPAGYGQVPHHTLSLSASLYRYEYAFVDNYFYNGLLDLSFSSMGYPEVRDNELESKKFTSFPGSVSMLWHLGPKDDPNAIHHVLSATIIIPNNFKRSYQTNFSMYFPQVGTRLSDVAEEVNEVTDYLFGPTYSINFGRFRLGLSAFVSYIDVLRINESTHTAFAPADDTEPPGYMRNSLRLYSEGKVFGVQPVLGFQWNVVKGFHLGASVSSPTIHLWGEMDYSATAESSGPASARDANYYEERDAKSDLEYRRPVRIRLGLSYEVPKRWAIALDANLKLPQNNAYVQRSSATQYLLEQGEDGVITRWSEKGSADTVIGFSGHLGAEIFLNEMFSWRLGGFYEQSVAENELQQQDILRMDLNYIGATTGLGIESELGETTFGAEFVYGFGSTVTGDAWASQDLANPHFRNVAVTTYNFIFFISGAFDLEEFGALMKAARNPKMLLGESREQLSLADLDPNLVEFQHEPVVADLLKGQLFEYPKTEIPEFDTVFKRVARIRASMVLAVDLASELEKQATDLKAALASEPDMDLMFGAVLHYVQTGEKNTLYNRMEEMPQVERTAQLGRLAVAIKELLERLGSDLVALPGDVQKLIEKAPQRFSGPDAIMLPAVARSLGAAEADIVAAAKEVPALIEALAGLVEALKVDPPAPDDDIEEATPAPADTAEQGREQ